MRGIVERREHVETTAEVHERRALDLMHGADGGYVGQVERIGEWHRSGLDGKGGDDVRVERPKGGHREDRRLARGQRQGKGPEERPAGRKAERATAAATDQADRLRPPG